ncbi:MAG: HemK family protein methyltransferase, partial [Bacteroidales bacterium]|nr:HemK family protein methyltransferase [Bacteroidales bacterium]
MKLRDYSKGLIEGLQVGGIYEGPEAESIVRRLAVDVLELKDYQFYSEQNKELTGPQIEELDRDGEKLLSGMPLQYVLGYESFCNHRFRVDPSVLIPRPETEELVKMTVETVSEGDSCGDCCDIRNVLDACTGSGCIAWSVAAAIPEVQVYGFDVSGEALNVACRQKVPFKGPRPVFLLADLMDDPPAGLPRMDVIVCNPPYVCE